MEQLNLELTSKALRVRLECLSDHNKINTHWKYHIHMDHTYQDKFGS